MYVCTYINASVIPLKCISPSAFLIACKRVFTTSNGLTEIAPTEPAAMPDNNVHLKYNFLCVHCVD